MAEPKKYYWLKLKSDFFNSKRIKKLRKMAGGDTYTIIYLKMQLLSIKQDGLLQWTGLEDNFAAELALDLDEGIEDVRMTLMYLESCGLIETSDNVNYFLPYAIENTGSETGAAERMREMRKRNNVTPLLHGRYTEIDIEKELEIEKDKEIDIKQKPKRFVPPTLEEVESYCKERNNSVDAKAFYDYYSAGEWKDSKGNPVKSWKQKLITWEKGDNNGRSKSLHGNRSTNSGEEQGKYDHLYSNQ